MPRNVDGTYSKAEPSVQANTTISSSVFNNVIDDLVTDANAVRPVSAGGTGGGTAALARLSLDVAQQQSSTADGTTGRGLVVGGGGLLGNALTKADFDELVTTNAFIRTGAASTPNAPTTDDEWSGINVRKSSDNGWQIMADNDNELLMVRHEDGGTWTDWMHVKVLVDVITPGSRGTAYRYSDGTQVCLFRDSTGLAATTANGNVFITSASSTWQFPAVFLDTTDLIVTGSCLNITSWVGLDTLTATTVDYRRICATSAAGAQPILLRAEGKWR